MMDSENSYLDAYAAGVWDTVAYINEFHRTDSDPLRWEKILTDIEQAREDGEF